REIGFALGKIKHCKTELMEMIQMRVYDRYLNLLHEVDAYQSFQLVRRFHSTGKFELNINRYMHGAEHFRNGNIVSLGETKSGIIMSSNIKVDENGKQSENIVAKGTTLDGLLERRITVPPKGKSHDKINDNAETVMKHYVEKNFLNPVDKERKFPNFMIAPNRGRGEKIKWESRYKNVAEEIEKISEETGLGWEITLDFKNNAYVFDVYESNDLSRTNEQGNDPVFFSPEFENIQSLELTRNDSEMRNYGYVAGQGEGEERKIIELGDESGWNRFETFIDARDVGGEDEDEEDMSENEIEEMLNERGKRKLN